MHKLPREICHAVNQSETGMLSEAECRRYQKRYRTILTQSGKELPEIPRRRKGKRGRIAKSDAHNLHEGLLKLEESVLRFMSDPDVSFTNNTAEQKIRISKVKVKVSGCFRTERFAHAWFRISSYLDSMAELGYNPIEAIQIALDGNAADMIKQYDRAAYRGEQLLIRGNCPLGHRAYQTPHCASRARRRPCHPGTSEGSFCPLSKLWCKSQRTELFGPGRERFFCTMSSLGRKVGTLMIEILQSMLRLSRDKTTLSVGIVHLGVGSYCRAHLAQNTEQAINRSGGDGGISGISLRSARTREDLAAQHYVYTAVMGSVGTELVSNVRPYETMKLCLLNGTHSALVYLRYLVGLKMIAETMECANFRRFIEGLWQIEIILTPSAPEGVSLIDNASRLMARYKNRYLQHLTWQIAMDGSQKLPQRILSTLDDRIALGVESAGLILSIAAWMRNVRGVDEAGDPIDVRGLLARRFSNIASSTPDHEDWVSSLLACREVFPSDIARYLLDRLPGIYRDLSERGAKALVLECGQRSVA